MKFRLCDGARFFLLGQRKVIFIESSQQIFEVDDVTACLSCILAEKTSSRELETELRARGIGREAARKLVRMYLQRWSREGLLELILEPDQWQPVCTQLIDIAGTVVAIDYYSKQLQDLISPVFDQLACPDGRPSVSYAVVGLGDRVCVSRNRLIWKIMTAAEVVPALRAMLASDVLAHLGTRIALHAALVVKQRTALALCGAPGAGKSTLAMALLGAGFGYGGDDITLLTSDGLLRGVQFAPALKQGSWRLLEGMQNAIEATPIHRRPDNRRVRYITSIRYARREAVPLASIVLLRRRKSGPAVVSAVEPARALEELLAGAFTPTRRLGMHQFGILLELVSRARAVQLSYSSLEEAAAVLSRHHEQQ
ncbi:serine kinase [Ensifer sp. MPMI2T]|nr:serine kinase [Ensifer sp. MPMI2T]